MADSTKDEMLLRYRHWRTGMQPAIKDAFSTKAETERAVDESTAPIGAKKLIELVAAADRS